MRKLHITFLLLLGFTSCAAPIVKFSDMSPTQLMTYNRAVEYLDQVFAENELAQVAIYDDTSASPTEIWQKGAL